MSKNQTPNNNNNPTSYGNANKSPANENEKRMNQVPNSKNPKVPGNEAPYR